MKQPPIEYQFNYPKIIYSDNTPPDPTDNVKTSGCGLVSMYMALKAFGIVVTLQQLVDLSLKNHFRVAAGTDWGFFPYVAKMYGLTLKQTDDESEVTSALKNGSLCICSMGPGLFTKHGHFILAYDSDGSNFFVNDPNSSARTGKKFSIKDIFKLQHKEYFIFTKPQSETEQYTLAGAIDAWSKLGIIGSPEDMKKDFIDNKVPARFGAFLLKSANFIKEKGLI